MLRQDDRPVVIEVKNLSFRYPTGDRLVLEGINLQIRKGEFIGITGPSGAGKSTLCYCLKGLVPHSLNGTMEGEVIVLGQSTRERHSSALAEQIAMVFQDPESQIVGLTVAEDLAFGPENLERDPREIRALIPKMLEVVRMGDFADRETYSLSGGQKQRTAIASALMMQPKIIILDEPTSELDPIGKDEVFKTIRRLREEMDCTVIIVEHAIEELAEMADRIIVMDQGHIVANDSPRQLFHNAELFYRTQGERLPQAAELLLRLEEDGLITPDQFTPYEDEAVELLRTLLQKGANG